MAVETCAEAIETERAGRDAQNRLCMLVQIRMYLGGAQPAVVKIPKKSLLAPLLSEEIV